MRKKYLLPYEEQFARVVRLNDGLKKYSVATDKNFEEAIDAFTSFFIQCYHLADWLKRSEYFEKSIYDFIKNSPYLSLCHALANTQKHQKTHSHDKQNDDCKFCDLGAFGDFGITTPIFKQVDHFDNGQEKFCIAATDFAPFPIEILELTNKCIQEWRRFIEIHPDPHTSKSRAKKPFRNSYNS
jgi:hypothetical protein